MNEQLLQMVLTCPRLPSLPSIAIEVIELCRHKDINIKQIAKTISNDPALSSKILRTVNSSYYGMRQPVSTISHALVILGLNTVKTLALGFSLTGNLKGTASDDCHMMQLWQRSIYTAVAARTIGRETGLVEHEEAFFGGLLQDLGMLAMIHTLGQQYHEVLEKAGDDHAKLWSIERKELDLDHALVGGELAEKWKLPPLLAQPIRYHEHPNKAPQDIARLVKTVAAGGKAAKLFLSGKAEAIDPLFDTLREEFKIERPHAEQMLSQIDHATREMADLFEIRTDQVANIQDILADANETLLELTLEQQQDSAKLENTNRQLQEQINRDSLTGAANRRRFNGFIHEAFQEAATKSGALSVLFVDADRFKSVNDTHGHMVGDKVLVTLAATLMEHCPGQGLVARYGGEEFAIVVPGVSRPEAAQLAERIRQAIAETPVDADDDLTLQVTVSMGVATQDAHGAFSSPEQLVQAADKAVYAAKAAGRNCVRVFVPRAARKAG